MIKLYGGTFSQAAVIHWYLAEIGVPFEFVKIDLEAGEQLQPEYLVINPMGRVPAIIDEDFQLWESGAILLYLLDKYEQKPLSLQERALINQWLFFSRTTLGDAIFKEASRQKQMPRVLNPLNKIFEHQPYILGDRFTVVDVAVGSTLAYASNFVKIDFSAYIFVQNYINLISSRPAFIESMFKCL